MSEFDPLVFALFLLPMVAGQLVIQDVLTLHGSQFRDADLIVASPPCQAYSYRAMPWSRAKALPPPDNSLFDACFRLQREACEASGRHIPLIVENVKGAQKWVGRSRWNFGSFHLWGDVPALMPMANSIKNSGGSWFNIGSPGQKVTGKNPVTKAVSSQKVASALIAKIPFVLSSYIARTFKPERLAA